MNSTNRCMVSLFASDVTVTLLYRCDGWFKLISACAVNVMYTSRFAAYVVRLSKFLGVSSTWPADAFPFASCERGTSAQTIPTGSSIKAGAQATELRQQPLCELTLHT